MHALAIISGGQTGVDRAALDAAMRHGIKCGGYCPRGYWAEDGKISSHYPLVALDDPGPAARTRANVDLADGVCIICPGEPAGGTALAVEQALVAGKPVILLGEYDLPMRHTIDRLDKWFADLPGGTINVAGPRLSEWRAAYQTARRIFDAWLRSKTNRDT